MGKEHVILFDTAGYTIFNAHPHLSLLGVLIESFRLIESKPISVKSNNQYQNRLFNRLTDQLVGLVIG